MNEKFQAAVPPTPEEIAEAKRKGLTAEDSLPAAVAQGKSTDRVATLLTQEEIELARRRNPIGPQGPDAAK